MNTHKKFEDYLQEIGEIPKDIEFDFENDTIRWRYLEPAFVRTGKDGKPYCSYGIGTHGEVLINGEVIGYFEIHQHSSRTPQQEEKNWFWREYILEGSIKRIWGVTHYIWG